MKIRKNDTVAIMKGKDAGKTGKVIQSFPKEGLVVVEGHNIRTKHLRASGNNKGQRVEYPAPLAVASLMLVCPACGKKTRVGFQTSDDGKKQRMCKKCSATFV